MPLPLRLRGKSTGRAAHAPLAGALRGRTHPSRPGSVRDRARGRLRGSTRRIGPLRAGYAPARLRHRRAGGGGDQGRDARHARDRQRHPAGGQTALPDGGGHAARYPRRDFARGGYLRLRGAHAIGAPQSRFLPRAPVEHAQRRT